MHKHPSAYTSVMPQQQIALTRKSVERKRREEVIGQNPRELWT